MPLVGSILIVGTSRSSGGTVQCDRCKTEINRAWTIRCANAGCDQSHSICGPCMTAVQQFACADPGRAALRLKHMGDRASPPRPMPGFD